MSYENDRDETDVVFVIGSKSDRSFFDDSKAGEILTKCGVDWELSICSTHRNEPDLNTLVFRHPMAVYVTGAGMAAQLAGSIAAKTGALVPVIGVALPSAEFPNAMDALLSLTRMPPGTPVLCAGIGKPGFVNAAIAACQIVGVAREEVREALRKYREESNPPAQMGVARG
ncbi:MAG: AIR carboxylase family protein [Candidatus Doudnabacteria bacterium]|nr:AIR carboxylase family protein [Candidatus Doudnabacteria bacterium]